MNVNFSTNLQSETIKSTQQERQKQAEKIAPNQCLVDLFRVAKVAIPLQHDVIDEDKTEEDRKVAELHKMERHGMMLSITQYDRKAVLHEENKEGDEQDEIGNCKTKNELELGENQRKQMNDLGSQFRIFFTLPNQPILE